MIQSQRCGCRLDEIDYEIVVVLIFYYYIEYWESCMMDNVFEYYIKKIKEIKGDCDIDLFQIISISGSWAIQID